LNFVHLHVHSEYSIGDGLFSPKIWAQAFKDAGFAGAALTDHGTMGGSLEFYYAAKSLGIKAVMGCEFYFNANPELKDVKNRSCQHIVLLAKNFDGWRSLLFLQKWSYTDGYYFRPRIGFDEIDKANRGRNLVCMTACIGGVLGLNQDDYLARYETLKHIFGDDLYVEIQGHDLRDQVIINEKLIAIPDIRPVVSSDCHFILKEHQRIQKMIKVNSFKNKESAESFAACDTNYMASARDIYKSFKAFHRIPMSTVVKGMENTEKIFHECNVELEDRRYLPVFSKKFNSKDLFLKLGKKFLSEFLRDPKVFRFGSKADYVKRFIKETEVILKYNLEDYFLIVWDILRFARSRGIYTGLGRGSSSGSFVCFLLKITQINPLQYDLIFERMLNEIRCELGELPDVDMDIESARRQEVKDYMISRYGRDKVCEIGTYGRLKMKSSIIDFGKQFGILHPDLLAITTRLELDKDENQSLEAAMASSEELSRYMMRYPTFAFAVDSLNGQIKSQSIHPAGVLICSDPICDVTPVKSQKSNKTKGRVLTTQSEDSIVLKQGLVKIDLLGLREYDIFRYIIDHIDSDLTMENYVSIIHDDATEHKSPDVWKMFCEGKTEAVFQFSGEGMKGLLKEIKPDCMNDLIAAVALYRPGCIENGWHIDYYKRKSGKEKAEYLCDELIPILGKTYGIPVFQEQVMEICNKIGKIPMTESDIIRSALGKKDMEKLVKYKSLFIEGAKDYLDEDSATGFWNQIEKSALYSFNKSHSAVYALVAYISQYFKVKYKTYYWAAVLDFDSKKNDRDRLAENRRAATNMGISILNLDINKSKAGFYVETAKETDSLDVLCLVDPIRWSFGGVRGVGPVGSMEIERCQPYDSFDDFYSRVNKAKVKFDIILNIAYAGAFDCWMERRECIKMLFDLYNKNKKTKIKKSVPKLSNNFLLLKFYEMTGYFECSLKDLFDEFPRNRDGSSFCFTEPVIAELGDGYPVLVGGMIEEVRSFKTKKGDPMGSIHIVDMDESLDVTVFPSVWIANRSKLKTGNIVLINGHKSVYMGRSNLINAEDIKIISSFSS